MHSYQITASRGQGTMLFGVQANGPGGAILAAERILPSGWAIRAEYIPPRDRR